MATKEKNKLGGLNIQAQCWVLFCSHKLLRQSSTPFMSHFQSDLIQFVGLHVHPVHNVTNVEIMQSCMLLSVMIILQTSLI